MTRSILCFKLLTVAKHLARSGQEDLLHLVHLPRGPHRLWRDSGHLGVQAFGVRPCSRIQDSLEATLPHSLGATLSHCYHGDLHLEGMSCHPLARLR
jgi:hypothetical protein